MLLDSKLCRNDLLDNHEVSNFIMSDMNNIQDVRVNIRSVLQIMHNPNNGRKTLQC